ncbi:3-isopropylmalate dehydratase, small subunit [Archaeoglobus sulfaticallidus PM70-1]|uniref:3-isopropylmalate dehydratase small subunit n=1 Tax=Archaeoglobus sulfaticallidus PM70-1 TaxID=387631 RepID=N0BKQ2_9EURY|nr:3-isopropylmalate dehydratase small subunit [Archaeoglobus sulfaticallidus]AGK61091.1 3-isopropylmalate dehydratase, small subunit [Archaeoglobus sulfaticallidus PM70-1]
MGRAWKFGDDIDTDVIIQGKYLVINDPEELAKHVFENIMPEFAKSVKAGDFVVAGENFGCGSSREHAPLALKATGVKAIIAKSFARIFFRNAINLALMVLECKDTDRIDDGDELEVDYRKGIIKNLTKGEEYSITPLPEFVEKIMEMGGLVEFSKEMYRGEA